jgi:HAD superfamily hydrolase (TIGR01509 family)
VIPRYPCYLFDVDGTLLDSAEDICGAVATVLAATPRPDVSFDFLKGYIGRHLNDLFGDLFPDAGQDWIDELVRQYRQIYPARGHKLTRIYPGVVETLRELPGLKSTATTKGTPTTRTVLELFGLLRYFDHVQGTDGFPCKPEPDVIFKSLKVLGVAPEQCLLVGDSAQDMEAGRKAGVRICAVRYGYGKEADLARWEPDYWISDLRELLSFNDGR